MSEPATAPKRLERAVAVPARAYNGRSSARCLAHYAWLMSLVLRQVTKEACRRTGLNSTNECQSERNRDG